ncbi:DUF1643 domain-containing protein [Cetobacterium sp.]|uniref:DUF1643 domain-containing protein n=1 Tax=Cetobacterium sp. TaxID=2071632 RepID=UPI003F32D798
MKIEKSNLKTEAIFSDNKRNRFLLKKEWDSKKLKAMVLMINPSTADEIQIDFTTLYTLNNLSKLGYGSVDVTNLYSHIGALRTREESKEMREENMKYIISSAEKVDTIILAYGSVGDNSKGIQEQISKVLLALEPFNEKTFYIGNGFDKVGLHPLAPAIRHKWNLVNIKDIDKIKGDE